MDCDHLSLLGTTEFASIGTPGFTRDPEWVRLLATAQRASMTPRTAAAQFDYVVRTSDVRWALPLIQVPTLVLHAQENPVVPIELGRFLADHIPNASLVGLPGVDLGRHRPSAYHSAVHRHRAVDRHRGGSRRYALACPFGLPRSPRTGRDPKFSKHRGEDHRGRLPGFL